MGSGRDALLVTTSKYTNFVSSLPMSGKEPVSIPMPFLPEVNRGDGPVRLTVNGRQLVWRMRYRNTPGAEKPLLRTKPSLIDWLPIYSPLFNVIPIAMFALSCQR